MFRQPDMSKLRPASAEDFRTPIQPSNGPEYVGHGVYGFSRCSMPLGLSTYPDAIRHFQSNSRGLPTYRIVPPLQQGIRPTI